ncbi:MAG: SAM-dependent DNA methyltransferase [Anaerolineae bacterium]|uniref:HsdM family class I SAM-dependent methyltransferase n=1 Tax=Promineifilum sp. TaxID=2664178 RepID=UPI001DEB409A|nr:SAM-dependent DNA methyltransferase [Anaerolineales bacterium]MCB8935211.1 SAM-dependent DNA methyltransferase [Promineifilum sp.]MCO5179004.1 N-6 DNA methylase [Promineifilum sp.]MCW5846241.1 SAM-dependent DNA methyltransferase [Anaerolineae bacterium]
MTSKQRTWGQFATPIDVADLLLGFCLRRPNERLLDPSCGDGALLRRAVRWRSWLASGSTDVAGTLHGIELDPAAASAAAAIPGVTVEQANFLTLDPRAHPSFDAVVGNPPYTRAEWIDRLDPNAGQLALFPTEPADQANASPLGLLPRDMALALPGRAGLYAYFFIHSLHFLREGGRLGFVVPNGWLDVAYGDALKQFLLDHFRIVAVVESAVERWFAAASINTCVVILERATDAEDRAANRVRFVRLRRPLRDLLGHETDSRRVAAVEQLITRLMPAVDRVTAGATVRVRVQGHFSAAARWSTFLRAPEVYLRPATRPVAPLGDWAIVHRGYTTGANSFFYPDRRRVEQWGIEPEFRRPLLKSLRGVGGLHLTPADARHEVLLIPCDAQLAGTGVVAYLAWGEATGLAARATCAGRRPWYALPRQPAAGLLLAKGIWQRHFAVVAGEPAVDQQIYRVSPAGVPTAVAAALLNSAWFALACELGGRVNLGEGVLWLATYELSSVLLPDPRALDEGARRDLESCFDRLAVVPIVDTLEALERPEQQALDELVFELMGFSPGERAALRAALAECLAGRRLRSQRVGAGEE